MFPGNNHLLHTSLVKLMVLMFGLSEFAVRLPALLGHVLYLSASWWLLRRYLSRMYLVIGVGVMVMNPYLLDLFSASRGYALALGFLMWSLYFLLLRAEQKPGEGGLSNTGAALFLGVSAVLANAGFLNIFLVLVAVLCVIEIRYLLYLKKKPRKMIAELCVFVILVFAAGMLMAWPIMQQVATLLGTDEHYPGGESLYDDTFSGLSSNLLYGREYLGSQTLVFDMMISAILLLTVTLVVFFMLYRKIAGRGKVMDSGLLVTWVLSTGVVVVWVLMNLIFSVKYPSGRTAVYLVPVFLLMCLLLWKRLCSFRNKAAAASAKTVMMVLFVLLLLHYMACLNFSHYHEWKYDADTKDMIIYVMGQNDEDGPDDRKGIEGGPVQIGVLTPHVPAVNFYRARYDLDYVGEVFRYTGLGRDDDYFYIDCDDTKPVGQFKLELVKKYVVSGSCLYVHEREKTQ